MKGSDVNRLKSLISFVVPLLQLLKVARQLTGCNSIYEVPLVPRLVLLPVAYLLKTYALLYPLSLFMLLSWDDCYRVGIYIYYSNFFALHVPYNYWSPSWSYCYRVIISCITCTIIFMAENFVKVSNNSLCYFGHSKSYFRFCFWCIWCAIIVLSLYEYQIKVRGT